MAMSAAIPRPYVERIVYGDGMGHSSVDSTTTRAVTNVEALIGLPFDDCDDVSRAAVAEASVHALLMSMVHMTGDLGLLRELPGPYALIAMDLQGAMSE